MFLLLLLVILRFGQSQDLKLTPLVPPPPDVSALGKFGLVPVDYFTGVADITIPIYTIDEGNLTWPVSIKYHSGGIKVKEDASEVGLGWALCGGGTIVSVTRGKPDFPVGFLNDHTSMPDPPSMITGKKSPLMSVSERYYLWDSDKKVFPYNSTENPTIVTAVTGLNLTKNGADKEYYFYFNFGQDPHNAVAPDFSSDLYIITIGEKSYKFIFDNSFKPVVLGDGSIKIELIENGNYPNWKVTDEQGIQYYFTQGQFYYASNSPINEANPNYGLQNLNTWHLTKVKSPIYGELNFTYQYENKKFIKPLPALSETYLVGMISPYTQQITDKVTPSYSLYEQVYLDKIHFSSGYMRFIYSSDRLDLQGAKRLTAVEVRQRGGDDKLVRKVKFDNSSYFVSTLGTLGNIEFRNAHLQIKNAYPQYDDNMTKRLRLNSVSEVDPAGLAVERKHTFSYNDKLELPSKLSLSIDHWGYYNGANNNMLLPPSNVRLSIFPTSQYYPGANRNANPANMQACVLTSIKYPTGGSSSFKYETNQYKRIDAEIIFKEEYSSLYKAWGSSEINISPGFVDASGNFTVGSEWNGKKLVIESFNSSNMPRPYPSGSFLEIVLRRNNYVLKRIPLASNGNLTERLVDSSFVLEPGNYNISYESAPSSFFNSLQIRRQLYIPKASWTSQQVEKTYYVGGLRISQSESFDPVSGKSMVKNYAYFDGVRDADPIYESSEGDGSWVNYWEGMIKEHNSAHMYRHGHSIYNFSDGRSSPYYGYEKVLVTEQSSEGESGAMEYLYHAEPSLNINTMLLRGGLTSMGIANPVPAPIPEIPSGFRGKLKEENYYKYAGKDYGEENYYKYAGKNYSLVRKKKYHYTDENVETVWQMLFNQGLSKLLTQASQLFNIYAHHFAIPINRNMLKKVEDFSLDDSGNSIVTSQEYQYDKTNGHYQVIKLKTETSKGDILITNYKYPQDYTPLADVAGLDSRSQGIKLLQQTHVVKPVETYKEMMTKGGSGSKYSSGLLYTYNTDLPTVKEVLALEPTTPLASFSASSVNGGAFLFDDLYDVRIQFHKYKEGRLLEQSFKSGPVRSYVWGYSNIFPVAEVINARQEQIYYNGFEEDPNSSSDVKAKAGTKYINGFEFVPPSGFTPALNSRLSYWGLENGKWVYHEQEYSGGVVTLSGNVDEVRIHPAGAQMTTYAYDPLVGMTSATDTNGQTTYYEYDTFGRLYLVKDSEGNILKKYEYHFQGQ